MHKLLDQLDAAETNSKELLEDLRQTCSTQMDANGESEHTI